MSAPEPQPVGGDVVLMLVQWLLDARWYLLSLFLIGGAIGCGLGWHYLTAGGA